MKKMIRIIFVVLVGLVILVVNVQAADNFLYQRFEFGEKKSGSEKFQGTYTVFENNTIEKWSLGGKVITGERGYHKLHPHVYREVFGGWHLGVKYSEDSLRNEFWGAAVRFKGKIKEMFIILDYAREFDFKNNNPGKNDAWLCLSSTNPTFNFGAEAWYYNFLGGDKFLVLRPIRLNYKYKLDFFVMPNFCFKNGDLFSRSLLVGATVRF